jgi:hypothetical protein
VVVRKAGEKCSASALSSVMSCTEHCSELQFPILPQLGVPWCPAQNTAVNFRFQFCLSSEFRDVLHRTLQWTSDSKKTKHFLRIC